MSNYSIPQMWGVYRVEGVDVDVDFLRLWFRAWGAAQLGGA